MQNPTAEVTKLSKFLGQDQDSAFIQTVCDSCDFSTMLRRKGRLETAADGQPIMYRKGQSFECGVECTHIYAERKNKLDP